MMTGKKRTRAEADGNACQMVIGKKRIRATEDESAC